MSVKWDLNSYEKAVFLAPMEGVVDSVVRDILTSTGAVDICTTEFVRVTHQLLPDHVFYKYAPELKTNSRTLSGTPVFLQLLGSDLTTMAENAHKAAELGAFGIDINFGCPAKRVNQHDGGANLLKDPTRVEAVVSSVRAAVPAHIPVTAKVRLGFDHKDFTKDIALAASSGGASALIVHARTKMEGYRPPAHWHCIAGMREAASIPVVANGEIWNKADYLNCVQESGCRHIMIGRGLVATPNLAQQIKGTQGPATWQQQLDYIHSFLHKTLENYGDSYTVKRLKQLLRMMGQQSGPALALFNALKTHKELSTMRDDLDKEIASLSLSQYDNKEIIVAKNF